MKYIDALVALAIMLVFAPILSAQYLRTDATWRKSIGMLRQISETKERISRIEESRRNDEETALPQNFRLERTKAGGTKSRDAIFFSFDGQELHWILGRSR